MNHSHLSTEKKEVLEAFRQDLEKWKEKTKEGLDQLLRNDSEKTQGKFWDRPLTSFQFILSQVAIIIFWLGFVGWLSLTLNQYNPEEIIYQRLRQIPVTQDNEQYTLLLKSPEDNLVIFQPTIVMNGKTKPRSKLLISAQDRDYVIEASSSGEFLKVIDLVEGMNNITLTSLDQTMADQTIQRTIYYSQEKL